MAQAVGRYAAKKMLNSQMKKYKDKEPVGSMDPYYEKRKDPRTGRMKKFKKQIPSYIPEHDAEILAACRKRAYHLDCALFNFLGVRFGWSSVIGLVPEIGDAIDAFMSVGLWRKINKIDGGLPLNTNLLMLMVIFADFVVGLVPFLGDYLDAMVKANTINVRLLEKHLDKKYKPRERRRREEEEAQRAGNPPPAPATEYEDLSAEEDLPQYSTHPPNPRLQPTRPERAQVPTERMGGPVEDRPRKKSGGWFSGPSRSKSGRPADPEMGRVGNGAGASRRA
jgi:hypothetical protein